MFPVRAAQPLLDGTVLLVVDVVVVGIFPVIGTLPFVAFLQPTRRAPPRASVANVYLSARECMGRD